MKKLIFILLVALWGILVLTQNAFANADPQNASSAKQQVMVVVNSTASNASSLTPKTIGEIKQPFIDAIMANTDRYTLIEPDNRELIETLAVTENKISFETAKELKMLGVHSFFRVKIMEIGDGFQVYCTQVDATNGSTINQGKGTASKLDYVYITAKEASAFIYNAKDSARVAEQAQKDLKTQIKVDIGIIQDDVSEFRRRSIRSGECSTQFSIKPFKTHSVGLSLGYVSRSFKTDGSYLSNGNNWQDQKSIPGFELGLDVNAYFVPWLFGLGVTTGVKVGYYSAKNLTTPLGEVSNDVQCLDLSIPVMVLYRHDFNRRIGVYANYGLQADIGLVSNTKQGEETYWNLYDGNAPQGSPGLKRLNYSIIYGAGVRVGSVKFGVSASSGILNLSDDESYRMFQNSNIQLGITFGF